MARRKRSHEIEIAQRSKKRISGNDEAGSRIAGKARDHALDIGARYCAGVRCAMTPPGVTITVSCTVRSRGG
jgi:hypothetical protein